jgi:hypothetical protein
VARSAPEAGKTTPEVPAFHILFHDMPDDGAPEAVLSFVALVPDAPELVKVVLDEGKQFRGARIAGPVDSLSRTLHIRANRSTDSVAKIISAADGQKDWANA